MNTTLPRPRPSGCWSSAKQSNNPIVVVGIDINHHHRLARLVYGDPQGYLRILGWSTFRDIDRFASYWKTHVEQIPRPASNYLVAVPNGAVDPIGIVPWLNASEIAVHYTSLCGHEKNAPPMGRLPATFGSAYDLCTSMAYRYNAHEILADTWFHLHSLCGSLKHVAEQLGCVVSAQTASEHWRTSGSIRLIP